MLNDYNRYRGGSKKTVLAEITYDMLATLFGVSTHTMRKYISNKKINPYSLQDIIEKYNNRELLDRRKRQETKE